jgi:hypothetical protein
MSNRPQYYVICTLFVLLIPKIFALHFKICLNIFQYQIYPCVKIHDMALKDKSTVCLIAPCVNSIKILFIVPTDAHYYKIAEMLKHLKL